MSNLPLAEMNVFYVNMFMVGLLKEIYFTTGNSFYVSQFEQTQMEATQGPSPKAKWSGQPEAFRGTLMKDRCLQNVDPGAVPGSAPELPRVQQHRGGACAALGGPRRHLGGAAYLAVCCGWTRNPCAAHHGS